MRLTVLLLCTSLLIACSPSKNSNMHLDSRAGWKETADFLVAQTTGSADWQKKWWIEKTVRVLRGGRGLEANENIDDFMPLSEDEIIQKLMNDPRLGNMVLDFNMYFMGFRLDTIWNSAGNSFQLGVFDFPTAIESARQVNKDGDYFKLFDLSAPLYMGHPRVTRDPVADIGKSDYDVLKTQFDAAFQKIKDAQDYLIQNPTASVKDACDQLSAGGDGGLLLIQEAGFPLAYQLDNIFNDPRVFKVNTLCEDQTNTTRADLDKSVQDVVAIILSVENTFIPLAAPTYLPEIVDDIRSIDLTSVGFKGDESSYGFTMRQALQNSSTNMDRKRSAYILKQFFCDDLTPIGVEQSPSGHVGTGPHGSDPSCFACHYKLDPMAGFFRDYGSQFHDYSKGKFIYFDDNAKKDRATYEQAWKSTSPTRAWDVGYVRSVADESLNSYGDKLEDLHALFRTAPEVKKCVVRRLFEYVVDPNQTIDGGYLDYLTGEFSTRAQTNSSDAFKWVVGELLKSQTFKTMDLDPSQCYDYAPGHVAGQSPPCRVAYLLQQNCVSCHGATGGKGNLNLSGWIPLPDGTYDFPHLDSSNTQHNLKFTMSAILDRLSTSDDDDRMPYKKYMSSQDRQELYLWAQGLQTGAP